MGWTEATELVLDATIYQAGVATNYNNGISGYHHAYGGPSGDRLWTIIRGSNGNSIGGVSGLTISGATIYKCMLVLQDGSNFVRGDYGLYAGRIRDNGYTAWSETGATYNSIVNARGYDTQFEVGVYDSGGINRSYLGGTAYGTIYLDMTTWFYNRLAGPNGNGFVLYGADADSTTPNNTHLSFKDRNTTPFDPYLAVVYGHNLSGLNVLNNTVPGSCSIAWNACPNVTRYEIYVNGSYIGSSTSTSATVSVSPGVNNSIIVYPLYQWLNSSAHSFGGQHQSLLVYGARSNYRDGDADVDIYVPNKSRDHDVLTSIFRTTSRESDTDISIHRITNRDHDVDIDIYLENLSKDFDIDLATGFVATSKIFQTYSRVVGAKVELTGAVDLTTYISNDGGDHWNEISDYTTTPNGALQSVAISFPENRVAGSRMTYMPFYEAVDTVASLSTLLTDLTDVTGASLGLTSSHDIVMHYQQGSSSTLLDETFNISPSSTLGDLNDWMEAFFPEADFQFIDGNILYSSPPGLDYEIKQFYLTANQAGTELLTFNHNGCAYTASMGEASDGGPYNQLRIKFQMNSVDSTLSRYRIIPFYDHDSE